MHTKIVHPSMKGEHPELLFVAVDRHGRKISSHNDRTVRSHVQRSISHDKKRRPNLENMRFIHVEHGKISTKRAYRKNKLKRKNGMDLARPEKVLSIYRSAYTSSSDGETSQPLLRSLIPRPRLIEPIVYHPFTTLVAKFVKLCPLRLDQLLKSDSFRTAAEPLFDSSHVDAQANMLEVFPNCEEEPVFLHALAFCIVQVSNLGKCTVESLSLKARTITLLNERLRSCEKVLPAAVIGAIMILKSVAYKFRDLEAHKIHTYGLNKALRLGGQTNLTKFAIRALFWLDLFATILVDSKRQTSHAGQPKWICWQPETNQIDTRQLQLPNAFYRYSLILPIGLLECIRDIVELQALLRVEYIAHAPLNIKLDQIDPVQASIESRLSYEATSCNSLFAEAIRIGVFMCCYCSWMETWNCSLVPCKMADKLITLLEPTLSCELNQEACVWSGRLDALLWLLLVISVVVNLDQGHVENLKGKQAHLLQSARHTLNFWSHEELSQALSSSLKDFMYCDQWLSQRYYNRAWLELEVSIETDMIHLVQLTERDLKL